MSQATDLIAEVKQLIGNVTSEVKSFEGEHGELGQFTDLAHLNIAKIHLGELRTALVDRRVDVENAAQAKAEADEADAAVAPAEDASWSESQGIRPLGDADVTAEASAPAESVESTPADATEPSESERAAAEQLAAAGVAAPGGSQESTGTKPADQSDGPGASDSSDATEPQDEPAV